MGGRVFLTDKLAEQHGEWLIEGLKEALFCVCLGSDVFEVNPSAILFAPGESAEFIKTLAAPKIFISNKWENCADDCVPADLELIIASLHAQINKQEKIATLERYAATAYHNGVLELEEISQAPANLLTFALNDDVSILEIQLKDYHNVFDHLTVNNPDAIIVKDDLEKLSYLSAQPEAKSLPIFFWSQDREKLLAAIKSGVDCYIPSLQQAEPRISQEIFKHRKAQLRYRQLNNTIEKAAKDSLTGLYNRHCLTTHLPALIKQVMKSRHKRLAVILLDIDRFKHVNDHWGHSVGDSILKNVAELLGETLRDGDNLYRLGGEEFLALIPNINSMEEAYALASRLCEIISETHFIIGEDVVPLTISAGVSIFQQGERAQALLKRADEALYRAKHLGRNRAA